MLDFDDAVIGDGDLEHIGCQVGDGGFGIGYRLAVDVPILIPDLGWDLVQQPGRCHGDLELPAEDFGQRPYRQKETGLGGMPAAVLRTQRPAGYHIVDVGMALQLPAPGVKHAEEAGLIAADPAGVGGQGLDGPGGGLEQRAVTRPLMIAQKPPQCLGHREGEQEVRAG